MTRNLPGVLCTAIGLGIAAGAWNVRVGLMVAGVVMAALSVLLLLDLDGGDT